jgi:hypothetical protein
MKHMRILGVAMVAVFALAAFAASGASATPGWYECAKLAKVEGKYTGKYMDKLCSVNATAEQIAEGKKNKYELQPGLGKNKPFKAKGTEAVLHVVIPPTGEGPFGGGAELNVKCTSAKGGGTQGLPNLVSKVTIEFKGCTVLAAPCQSGSKKGVITTNALSGEEVAIEGGSGIGTLLKAEAGPTAALASFVCTEVGTSVVHGSVISEHTGDVGVISKEAADNYTVGPELGEVEFAPGKKYTPIVNNPTHVAGGVSGEHFLITEVTEAGHEKPAGNLPSGQQGVANEKGEPLMIKP